ncbi:MAG: hypothetical protein IKO32_13070 [Lachnospiraceae bacterium]|nr:hypothetical protein [Lachnospiraceae bacterium]
MKSKFGKIFYEKTDAVITGVGYEYNQTARSFIRNRTKLKLSYTVGGESYGAELSGKGLITPIIVILGSAYGIIAGFLNIKRAKDAAQKRKEFFESDTDT